MTGDISSSASFEDISYESMYNDADMYVKDDLCRRPSTLPYQLTIDQINANESKYTPSLPRADEVDIHPDNNNVFDDKIYTTKKITTDTTDIRHEPVCREEFPPRSSTLSSMNSAPFHPRGAPPPPTARNGPQNGFMTRGEINADSEDTDVPMGDLPPPPLPPPDLEDANIPTDFPPPPPMADVSGETKQNIANIRARFLQEEKQGSEVTTDQKKRWSAADESEVGAPKERIAAFKAQFESAEQKQSVPEKRRSRPMSDIQDQFSPSWMKEEAAAVKRRPPAPIRNPHTRLTMGTEHMVKYHEHKQRSMSNTEPASSHPSDKFRRISDTHEIPPPPVIAAPLPPQQPSYGNVHDPMYGNVQQVPHSDVQQPLYGNVPQTQYNNVPHVPFNNAPQFPSNNTPRPLSSNILQPIYGNLPQPESLPDDVYSNIPPPPTEAPPPIPTNSSNVFTMIPGVVKASKMPIPPPAPKDLSSAPPPPPGPAPPPPPGPAPPPPPGLPPAPALPPPPPPPMAPSMGGPSGYSGGLLDGIMNVQLSSVPAASGEC